MRKDGIEQRIGRVIAWRVFRMYTCNPHERLKLARMGKQAVKSNCPWLNHVGIALETDIALQSREDAITIRAERVAWQILGDWQ